MTEHLDRRPESAASVHVRWTPEPADWVEAFRAVSWIHRWARVAGCVAAAAGVVSLGLRSWTVGCVLIAVGIFYFFLTDIQVRSAFRRNPRAAAANEATLDVDGIRIGVADARSQFDWPAFSGWLERSRSVILRLGKKSSTPVLVLPKRGFADEAQRERARILLAGHVPSRPRVRFS